MTDLDALVLIRPNFRPSYLVIHHSLTRDGNTVNWNAIRRYHVEVNGWSTWGYHWGVERVDDEYRILEGRTMLLAGAHTKDGDFNHKSIGVCMVGNFDLEPVPVVQWKLTLALCKKLCGFLDIQPGHVIGHREAQEMAGIAPEGRKSCPGRLCDMNSFRSDLTALMAA